MFDSTAGACAVDEPVCPEWSRYVPDGLLASILGAGATGEVGDFERLERIGGWEHIIAWAQANQLAEIAEFVAGADSRPDPHAASGMDSAVAEVGLMLRVSRSSADLRVTDAINLTEKLPHTLAALRSGRISLPAARAIAEESADLSTEHTAAVERTVLGQAGSQTPAQIRAAARRAVLSADPEAAARLHARARRERSVRRYDQPDGMATLAAHLTAGDAIGVYGVLDEHARRAAGADEDRSMDARRADALVDLILDGAGRGSGDEPGIASTAGAAPAGTTPSVGVSGRRARRPGAQVRVTLPVSTLFGQNDQPAELAGYGPITAQTARELAADATLRRLLTDPPSGALLDYGTARYSPRPSLAEHVVTRDQTCVFPGCRIPAHRCDLDHREPHDPLRGAGPTSADNLDAQCRGHHRLKHRSDWTVERGPEGAVVWTTPSGHTYRRGPAPLALAEPAAAPAPNPDTRPEPPPF